MLKDSVGSTMKSIPSDSRSSNASQCRRLFFSCEPPEVDGRGVLADVSFKRIVPASLTSFKRGRCSDDFEELPSGKTEMHAVVLSVRRAVRKADRETCMAGKGAPPIGSHQDSRRSVMKYLLSSDRSSDGHTIPTANACHVRC
jgi:hypothetical protein